MAEELDFSRENWQRAQRAASIWYHKSNPTDYTGYRSAAELQADIIARAVSMPHLAWEMLQHPEKAQAIIDSFESERAVEEAAQLQRIREIK